MIMHTVHDNIIDGIYYDDERTIPSLIYLLIWRIIDVVNLRLIILYTIIIIVRNTRHCILVIIFIVHYYNFFFGVVFGDVRIIIIL